MYSQYEFLFRMLLKWITEERQKTLNVTMLGVSFCLIFGGYRTMASIQTLVYESAKDPEADGYVEGYKGNGLWRSVCGKISLLFIKKVLADIHLFP